MGRGLEILGRVLLRLTWSPGTIAARRRASVTQADGVPLVLRPVVAAATTTPDPMSAARTVLVVEDDPTVRATMALILESEGYVTVTASNGRDALAIMGSRPPDAVLLDLQMPIMTGWELIEACRSDPAMRHLPLIVMSALNDRTHVGSGDVQAFLPKPFGIDQLLDVLKDALG
jgi:two-component system response regulator VicR